MVDSGMAEYCFLPQDIMLCIFTHLLVKSLVRFKSVCKSLCELFDTPEFIKMHLDQFSSDPKNQSFIIHHSGYRVRFSLLSSIESSGEKKSRNLRQPCPTHFSLPDILGCCNGLVCMGDNPLRDFVMWNPALKIFKHISLPRAASQGRDPCWWSWWMPFGLCYDAEEADFKVVVICVPNKKIGLYSTNADSWKTIEIKLDFEFTISSHKNEVIVNGNPYWKAKVDGNLVLVWFDVRKLDLKIVPLSSTFNWQEYGIREVRFVDWEGRLSALVYFYLEGRIESWVLSDCEEVIWRKNHEFRPIDHQMEVGSVLACWNDGEMVVWEYKNTGKLFVEDPENGCVDEIVFDETPQLYFGIYHYTESLAYVKGMIKY